MLTPIAQWLNTNCAAFDESVAVAVHQLYNLCPAFFTPFMNLVSLLGKGGIFLILLSLMLIICKRTRRFGTGMLLGLALGALLVNCCLKIIVARPRPYSFEGSVYYRFWQLTGMHMESDMSFPSGHTNAAFAAMVPLWLALRKEGKKLGILYLLFGVLMMVSRIYLSVHYTTDVLGGMVTGILAGFLGYFISTLLPAAWYSWRIGKKGAHEA